ncbi:DUF503 domain-containing protein [candidate division KSB1 bacterium]|nr:DUF503 domain-containing protein [candidate division KSB1 bacterium]
MDLKLSGCCSLKQKRSAIKPLINRLHKEFNVSAAEVEKNDHWDESLIACALISNDKNSASVQLNAVKDFLEHYWRDVNIMDYSISFI